MSKRLEACRNCLDGASNEKRIATALVEAIDEVRAEGGDPRSDALVHGILSQLTNVLGCGSLLTHESSPERDLFKEAYDLCYGTGPEPMSWKEFRASVISNDVKES